MVEAYDYNDQMEWVKVRQLYGIIYNVNVDRKYRKEPDQLIPLPIDKRGKPRNKQMDLKDFKDLIKKIRDNGN